MAEATLQVKHSPQLLSHATSVRPAALGSRDDNITNPKTTDASYPNASYGRESKGIQNPHQTSSGPNMSSGSQVSGQDGAPGAPIDPISRQIFQRTQSQNKVSQVLHAASSHTASGPSDEPLPARQSTDPAAIRRVDSTASSKVVKDKKKGVSFLSRIMGGKKREDSFDLLDNESEMLENRPAGNDAEVFSQPIGFIPKFPPPPKYIKIKTQNRRQKDFDRVFLAQVLLGEHKSKNTKPSDAQIVSIDDAPQMPTPQAGNASNRAVWAMEFSKDGKYLAAAGQDKKVRVWAVISSMEDREAQERGSENESESESRKLNAPVFGTKLIREYDGHTSAILDLSWSKNNFLLSSSMDKTVRLYHVSRPECLCAFKHNDFVTSIQFHPRDDRFFLAGSLDSKLRLWSIPDKNVAYWAQVPDMVTAVAFTPDGKTALAGCLNGLCILYDTEGLKAHSQIHVRSARGRNAKGSKITGIDTISIPRENGHHDVKLLITSNDSRVRMYNLKDRNLEIKFRGNENSCSQIHATFSDDGKYVICGSEDRRVYIWPTGPIEKGDPEKRPVEVFEAHSAIVTTALLAPTKTRQLLAQSGDPLYDLCNPPPITLLSRSDSVISSKAPTEGTGHSDKVHDTPSKTNSPRRAPETPAYIARQAHNDGNIIVTADYTGQIKIFRQDCAFQKRKQESWESNSVFSKKILGRSGSVTTRTSASSSLTQNRYSLNLGSKNPSADRIINWRDSISGATAASPSNRNSLSEINLAQKTSDRTRSSSPKKPFSHRFSLRHGSTPLADTTNKPSIAPLPQPEIAVSSPTSPTSPDVPEIPKPAGQEYNPVPHDPNDPLFLQGSQSFMYWNVKETLAPMVNAPARTPGLLGPNGTRNPLSRSGSYVSELSSEMVSSEGASDEGDGDGDEAENVKVKEGKVSDGEGDDLKCSRCGNDTFKATLTPGAGGGSKLKCRRCGFVV